MVIFLAKQLLIPRGNSKDHVFEVNSSIGQPQYHGELKAITMLRFGRQVDNHVDMPTESLPPTSPKPTH